ncbi:hypothetical protein B0A49_12199 [Cryomyces minteri]|uniref:Uncharacterized protein n=1 Tax=Cryomyces minteri TaxID=331657 RepID=A0A4U0VZ91_9PEZI|nr:hypothetical protein B0A49_12199 [Cryomyces minteri]
MPLSMMLLASSVGGQGITSGFRDAISLSWRLKIAVRSDSADYQALFAGWAAERKQQLERSLASTIENGNFCNEPSRIKAFIRNWYLWVYQLIPSWKHSLELGGRREGMTRYDYESGMPFLPQYSGGKSFPQVFSAPINGPAPPVPTFTDDAIFAPHKTGIFQLVALVESMDQCRAARSDFSHLQFPGSQSNLDSAEATFIVHGEIPSIVDAPVLLSKDIPTANVIRVLGAAEYTAAGLTDAALAMDFPRPEPKFYDPNRIRKDLGSDKVYVIVRWDRFVFAACRNLAELQWAVSALETTLHSGLGEETRVKSNL